MKPKNLKHPFIWSERRVQLEDGILFVPAFYEEYDTFTFPHWSDPAIFGNDKPVHIEFCSGNGSWIVDKAQQHPEINWVAVEKRFDRVRKIWSKTKNFGLSNLFIVCGEALTTSSHFFPEASVAQTYVNFPDPWPKKRHAKHRIIQEGFAEELKRLLVPGGEITLVTDDPTYSIQMEEVMKQIDAIECLPVVNELPGYGTSFFEELWREKGKTICYHRHRKACS